MTPSLISAEGLSGLLFLGFIGITLYGALIATGAKRLIRSVAGLALCFLGVAGLYYYLASPFVALMQLLIYVGAVCVTIIFAVMLAENDENKRVVRRNPSAMALAIIASAGLIWAIITLSVETEWKIFQGQGANGSMDKIGESLLTTYSMSFELISVVLLVAIVGSLVLARSGRSKT